MTLKSRLKFCAYDGSSCCNATRDAALQSLFQSLNVSDSRCSPLLKSLVCAVRLINCSFNSHLFSNDSNS